MEKQAVTDLLEILKKRFPIKISAAEIIVYIRMSKGLEAELDDWARRNFTK